MTEPKEKTDNTERFSLAMKPEIAKQLDLLIEKAGAPNRNVFLNGVVAVMTEDQAVQLYRRAIAEGKVRPKGKADPEKKALLKQLEGLSAEQLASLLGKANG